MSIIKKFLIYLVKYPDRLMLHLWDALAPIIPDKLFLAVKFRLRMGYWMDFRNPQTYTEKLQWLKLYNRQSEYTMMVDKYAVKEYVKNIIGVGYIIPTLGIWDTPEQIDWTALPNQFILKTTDGGGSYGIVIVKDKNDVDKYATIQKLHKALKQNIYTQLREWPYKNVPKKIIAEQYIADELNDYKFYCFDGEPKLLLIASNRYSDHNFDYFDMNFQHLDIKSQFGEHAKQTISKPPHFEEMKQLAHRLSEGIPHVRVDLYNHNGQILFGELTFFDSSGYDRLQPNEWDLRLGEWITLPNRQKACNE